MTATYVKSSEYLELPLESITDDLFFDALTVVNGQLDNVRLKMMVLIEYLSTKGIGGNSGSGFSAYQVAVDNGFEGTEQEWLASLVGKSAYQIATDLGYEGTVEEWNNSLVGKSAYQTALNNGYQGTEEEWLASLKGKSAYDVAVSVGFVGTETDFILSLQGKSAYDSAVKLGYVGTEAQWLLSLKGPQGEIGPSLTPLGGLESLSEIPSAEGQPDGAFYIVGKTIVFAKEGQWLQGIDISGPAGMSAYLVAVEQGYEGTVDEWLDSLRGQNGIGINIKGPLPSTSFLPQSDMLPGDAYVIDNTVYVWTSVSWEPVDLRGLPGKSAYEVAKPRGFVGTADAWLASLVGKSAYLDAKAAGFPNTETLTQWLNSLNGKSNYQIAVDNGFVGTESEYLATLVGLSAYQIAVVNGFEGTVAEWLLSIKGVKGDPGESIVGPQGLPANAVITKGYRNTVEELPTDAEINDAYYVGRHLWVWLGDHWFDAGELRGADGKSAYESAIAMGFAGSELEWVNSLVGKSAYDLAVSIGYTGNLAQWLTSLIGLNNYQIAVNNGFQGTEQEYLNSLKGTNGKSTYELAVDQGFVGTVQDFLQLSYGKNAYETVLSLGLFEGTVEEWVASLKGINGTNGFSAYKIAQTLGYTGTEQEWLASLVGKTNYQIAVENGFAGTEAEWLTTLVGKSNYQLAVDEGFEGTVLEWFETLRGPQGKSPYDLAVESGFEGTLSEWVESLKGAVGKNAYELAVDNGFEGTVEEWLASLVGPQGDPANPVIIMDVLTSENDIPPTGNAGEAYYVGTDLWVWVYAGFWKKVGSVIGLDGKSAYQVAVDNGFVGTEAEWLQTLVGMSAYDQALSEGYVGTFSEWVSEVLRGPSGKSIYELAVDNGFVGTEEELIASFNGKNNYELAIEAGFVGTLSEYLSSLIGPAIVPKGTVEGVSSLQSIASPQAGWAYGVTNNETGELTLYVYNGLSFVNMGKISGPVGADGPSAYQVAVSKGFAGTETEWLTSLQGKSAYSLAVALGYEGTEQEWLDSLVGPDGKSVYQVAVDNGFEGTEEEYLLSLIGASGKSNYQIAVDNGFVGTEAEWLASLKGEKGTRWIIFDRNPTPIDGVKGDYYLNSTTLDAYEKLDTLTWFKFGKLGGGNLYDADHDGIPKCLLDGEWVSIPEPVFDKYSLAVTELTPSNPVIDLAQCNCYILTGSLNYTLTFANIPEDRATHVDILILGTGGSIIFPTEMTGSWDEDTLPEMGTVKTHITVSFIKGIVTGARFVGV